MTQDFIYSAAGIGLFIIGLYGLVTLAHILRKLIATNIMGLGIFMVLIATSRHAAMGITDPVPHAMVLTGIVVAVAGTALSLWLAVAIHRSDSTFQQQPTSKSDNANPTVSPAGDT